MTRTMKKSLNAYIVSAIDVEVCAHISVMITPDSACHTRPRVLNGQNSFYIASLELSP
jgi:hypothetical protein